MTEEIIHFNILDIGIYEIYSKKLGKIGFINYNIQNKKFVFLPEKGMFYLGLHLAIILQKLNELNDYKRSN